MRNQYVAASRTVRKNAWDRRRILPYCWEQCRCIYLPFFPELLQEKRKNSNTRNGSNTSNISNIGKSYPEILKKQGNGFIRIFVLVVYTVEGILLAGYGLFLLSDLMVSELLKDSSFVLAAVLLMLLCGYGIWQGIEGQCPGV